MRPLTELLPHDEALRRIVNACQPTPDIEDAPAADAVGRVLARDVHAAHDVPSFARAAMDGYAVRTADARVDSSLLLVRVVHAGDPPGPAIEPGTCVQIATGAPVPPGTDAVVPVERTRLQGGRVHIDAPPRTGQHVSPAGADVAAGAKALAAGSVLHPFHIAVAAAIGAKTLPLWRRPRVAILSTGSELRPAGESLAPGQVHDSNGPALAALFRSVGASVEPGPLVPDDVMQLRKVLTSAARRSDLVVASGASSAGERDVLRDAVAAEGQVEFHGVRVKPGKPLLLGRIGATPLVGLPGYPASCLSDAYLFVVPAVRRIAHHPVQEPRQVAARMAARVEPVADRLWFVPVNLQNGLAWPTFKDSGATTSLADASGYVAVPPDGPGLIEGDPVTVTLF
jgi:molybdenum cofactor synthesis domain-containing protein